MGGVDERSLEREACEKFQNEFFGGVEFERAGEQFEVGLCSGGQLRAIPALQ